MRLTQPPSAVRLGSLRFLLGPILPFLDDPTVSEVMINGPDEVRIERAGRIVRTDTVFASEDDLLAAVRNIAQFVGKRIGPDTARFDARLPDGSRVHVVLPPISRQGVCVAIRKFLPIAFTVDLLEQSGAITAEAREFLEICVRVQKNILISGGTGSGKTTLLNVLSALIPDDQRILVLEETTELRLQQDHVLY